MIAVNAYGLYNLGVYCNCANGVWFSFLFEEA